MNKYKSIIFSLILTLIIFFNIFFIKTISNPPFEEVHVLRAIDGDTLELSDGRKIRLVNVNSPEKSFSYSGLSFNFLNNFSNSNILIQVTGIDKYSRYLAKAYNLNGEYINLKLVANGFASKFLVDEKELEDFSIAERNAVDFSKGIWNKSEYYGCIITEINPYSEKIIIENICSYLSLNGAYIKDESRKIFIIPNNIILENKFQIHSGYGKNNRTDLYWRSEANIWNDDRDTLYFFEENDLLLHFHDYGY